MTFEATIDAATLAEFVNNATALVDEARVHVDSDKMWIRAVDPANVGMVEELLRPGAFDSYNAEGGTLGLDLRRTEEVLKMASPDDIVILSLDVTDRNLDIEFEGLHYTQSLIDPDTIRSEPDIPDLDLPADPRFVWSEAERALRAADMVSDHIRIVVEAQESVESPDGHEWVVVFSAQGDTDDMDYQIRESDLGDDTEIDGEAKTLLSLEYLKDMQKPIPSDATVHLSVGVEFPVKLSWSFAETLGEATYMLAPRLESD